jgi:ferritin-like metal-binding protein YciE
MGIFGREIHSMDDLFVHALRDIYYAENQMVKALPDMFEKATDPTLKQGFQTHLGETRNHIISALPMSKAWPDPNGFRTDSQ